MEEVKKDNEKKYVWVLIHTAQRSHFGRLRDFHEFNEETRRMVYGIIKNNSALIFDILLDYFSPITKVPVLNKEGKMSPDPRNPTQPVMGIARESILTNFEHVMGEHPVAVFRIEKIDFVDDLRKADKQLTEHMIENALNNIFRQRTEDAGLVGLDGIDAAALLKGGPLPPGVSRMPDTAEGKPHFRLDLRDKK